MTGFHRYAIYYTPPRSGALARFGAAWLGWDIASGQAVAHPDLPGLSPLRIDALTETPRRYGFHATLRPPFRLASGHSADTVLTQLRRICATLSPVPLAQGLRLAQLDGFLALIPPPSPELTALSSTLLRGLDPYRAPLSRSERARHNPDSLSIEQRDNLDRWGYPWVMQQFRFHLTLTGPLGHDQAREVIAALGPALQPILSAPISINAVTLCGEDSAGRFHVIEKINLTEAS